MDALSLLTHASPFGVVFALGTLTAVCLGHTGIAFAASSASLWKLYFDENKAKFCPTLKCTKR